MLQCPICQTKYVEGVEYCSACGWDLTPYPLTFQLPQAFVEKERAKLAWAKQMWGRVQSQQEQLEQHRTLEEAAIAQLQSQLNSSNQESSKLQSQLERLQQDQAQLQSQLSQSDQEQTHLQSQLKQVSQERSHLAQQLDQVLSVLQLLTQKQSPDVSTVLSHLGKHLESMEAQLQLANKILSHLISNLSMQLAQEIAQIADKSQATVQIDELLQSQPSVPPYTIAFLEVIKSVLAGENMQHVDNLKEYLAAIGHENPITQVDALLNAHRELKLRGIIKRDIDGDTLYDF